MSSKSTGLLKHSGIYAVGTVLNRFASVLLLPVYTAYLTPADYGVIAILDLTVVILGIFTRAGISEAVSRYHFQADSTKQQDTVWWTGLTLVTVLASAIIGVAWFARYPIAEFTLKIPVEAGATYYAIILPTLWFGTVGTVFEVYLRIKKRSVLYVSLSLGKLLLNIALNVMFLAHFGLGITGILIGNLISGALLTVFLSAPYLKNIGSFVVSKSLCHALVTFGGPLIITTFLAFLMHNADRYFLQHFSSLDEVGLYSLAYQLGQGANMLVLLPFGAIWGVVMYEVAGDENARQTYIRTFQGFTSVFMASMLGMSLFSRPLLRLIANERFQEAATVAPIICLAYVFFSATYFFSTAAKTHGQTRALILPSVTGCLVNLGLNFATVPYFGMYGAAWVSVATYLTQAAFTLWASNKVYEIRYPVYRQLYFVAIAAALYGVFEYQILPAVGPLIGSFAAALLLFAFTIFIFREDASRMLARIRTQTAAGEGA